MTYLEKINNADSIENLKKIGKRLITLRAKEETKNALIKAYREKRRELYRRYADNSNNTAFKSLLYEVNTIGIRSRSDIASIGKTIYESAELNKIERDILFRAYRYQKAKHGIEFKNTEGV